MARLTARCRLAGLWLAVHALTVLSAIEESLGRRRVAALALAVAADLAVLTIAAVACGSER